MGWVFCWAHFTRLDRTHQIMYTESKSTSYRSLFWVQQSVVVGVHCAGDGSICAGSGVDTKIEQTSLWPCSWALTFAVFNVHFVTVSIVANSVLVFVMMDGTYLHTFPFPWGCCQGQAHHSHANFVARRSRVRCSGRGNSKGNADKGGRGRRSHGLSVLCFHMSLAWSWSLDFLTTDPSPLPSCLLQLLCTCNPTQWGICYDARFKGESDHL